MVTIPSQKSQWVFFLSHICPKVCRVGELGRGQLCCFYTLWHLGWCKLQYNIYLHDHYNRGRATWNIEYSLEGLMLKLELQYFGHLMRRASSLEKTLMLGRIEGKRRRGRQWIRWFYSITDSMVVNLRKLRKTVKDRAAFCVALYVVAKSRR